MSSDRRRPLVRLASSWGALVAAALVRVAAAQPCEPAFVCDFPTGGMWRGSGAISGAINDMAWFDDGAGKEQLYAAGYFDHASRVASRNIVRLSADGWQPVANGVDGEIHDLLVFDDGTGAALYAAGVFSSAGGVAALNVARWDGEAWSALGPGLDAEVRALSVFDDGNGPRLYAGGRFRFSGDVAVDCVARWDGDRWSPLGAGFQRSDGPNLEAVVEDLCVFRRNGADALVAGGLFSASGELPLPRLGAWDGSAWRSIGEVEGRVASLVADNDSAAPVLYVGGFISEVSGVPVGHVARWDGAEWAPLDTGFNSLVGELAIVSVNGRRSLYAAGSFVVASGSPVSYMARWNGEQWEDVAGGIDGDARSLIEGEGEFQGSLLAVGNFSAAGELVTHSIARYDGSAWHAVVADSGIGGRDAAVRAIRPVVEDGATAIYVGGYFSHAGGRAAPGIARWQGGGWSPVGEGDQNGVVGTPRVIERIDGVPGLPSGLYVGGWIAAAGGLPATSVVRWDGSAWHVVGSPLVQDHPWGPLVASLAVFDDGTGPALYAAGWFGAPGQPGISNIAKLVDDVWQPVGQGLNDEVFQLTVFDDGAGPRLYAVGRFTQAPGFGAIRFIARWDGAAWSPLTPALISSGPLTMTVADIDGVPKLYFGGGQLVIGASAFCGVAAWDGKTLTPIPMTTWDLCGVVTQLGSMRLGQRRILVASGNFRYIGFTRVYGLAYWDGSTWSGIGGGTNAPVHAIATSTSPAGDSLWIGGDFLGANGLSSRRMAHFVGCPWCPADWNADGLLTSADFFDFLLAFFAGDADYDGSGQTDSADFFAYVAGFLNGCE